LIRYLLVFLLSFLFFRCLLVHDGASLRTIEIPADLFRLQFVSKSSFSYGGGVARAAVPGGPLAATHPGCRPGADESAPSPPLGGVGGGWGLFPSLGRAAIGRPATAPTSIAVRPLSGGGSGGAHPLGGQGQRHAHPYNHKVKDTTTVVRVFGGVHVVSVRVSAAAVLSVLVLRGVLVVAVLSTTTLVRRPAEVTS